MTRFEEPNIHPDKELKRILEGNVTIHKAGADAVPLTVYRHMERPETGLPDDFIDIMSNGVTRAVGGNPLGLFRGSLALAVYCKTRSGGSVKRDRVDRVVSRIWELTDGRKSGAYMFRLDPQNVITPTSVNVATGYSVTALNVAWRADAEKLKAAAAEPEAGASPDDEAGTPPADEADELN